MYFYHKKTLQRISIFIAFLFIQQAFSQNNTENKGLFFFKKAYKFDCNQKKDSAFYYYLKAEKQYKKEQNKYSQARVLLNISHLQREQNDLIGCENSLIEALKIFEQLSNDKKLFTCYNKLGILLKDSEQFNKAQNYYNKALEIAKKLKNTKFQLIALSNIAINYKAQKKYKKAIDIFNQILKHDSIVNYPIKKTRALNYIAYCNFKLHKNDNLPNLFYKAKQIYKANKHTQGIITSNLHLAEYYLSEHKKIKAKRLLDQALNMAKANKKNSNILLILKLLAKADTINASHYFSKYTKLTDSITKVQSLYRNQFARISYETQKKEQKIKSQQATIKAKNKRQKLLFAIVILSVLSVFMLLFFNKKLKRKNIQIQNLHAEIRHRLKNNLSVITRFIDKAKQKTDNSILIENYDTLNGRINSIKAIQELLYKNTENDEINLKQIIHKICKFNQHLFNKDTITINEKIENILIPSKKAELIGLIINELITNAYKYAFVNKSVGNINIKVFNKDKNILLLISDDGIGFPDDFNTLKSDSYGIKLIKGLTKQLGGKITFRNTKTGTLTTLKIPLK